MAPKKKTRTGDTLNSRLALVMKSGKVVLGYKSTLKGTFFSDDQHSSECGSLITDIHITALRSGKAKLVLISGNTPPLRKSELEYYSMLSKAPVHHYGGTNVSTPLANNRFFFVGRGWQVSVPLHCAASSTQRRRDLFSLEGNISS